jgi:hypothetical protein
MKSILIFILLNLAVFTLSSCKKSNPVSTPAEEQIYPLAIGDTWVTLSTVYDTTGVVLWTELDTSTVWSDTIVSGKMWYSISSLPSRGPIYYTNESDGFWEMIVGISGPTLLYKFPANAGDTWSVQGNAVSFNKGSLLSNGVSVTVPKGTYDCYEYRMFENSQLVEDAYFYPGVGLVELNVYSNTNSGRPYIQVQGELVSFSLK